MTPKWLALPNFNSPNPLSKRGWCLIGEPTTRLAEDSHVYFTRLNVTNKRFDKPIRIVSLQR